MKQIYCDINVFINILPFTKGETSNQQRAIMDQHFLINIPHHIKNVTYILLSIIFFTFYTLFSITCCYNLLFLHYCRSLFLKPVFLPLFTFVVS